MKRIIFSLCFFALFFSCQTSDDNTTIDTVDPGFYALKVGNSWTYKNYKYNEMTKVYDDTGVVDFVKIVGTEVVNDITYFKFRTFTTGNEDNITFCNPNGESFQLLRDFEGNLMNENGKIKFTNNDFSERVVKEEIWGTVYEKLVAGSKEVVVEAGTFTSVNSERYIKSLNGGDQQPGLDRFYYSDGIGLISDTSSFVSNPIHSIERRLDSYILK